MAAPRPLFTKQLPFLLQRLIARPRRRLRLKGASGRPLVRTLFLKRKDMLSRSGAAADAAFRSQSHSSCFGARCHSGYWQSAVPLCEGKRKWGAIVS